LNSNNHHDNSNSSIVISSNGSGITAEMTVAAGTERVWRILTSFDEMDAHLSGLTTSKVLTKEGNYLLVEQRTKVGISLLSFTFRVLMDVVEDRPFLYFSQREGSFATFRGHWRVEPASEGKGTLIRYYLEASPAQSLGGRQFGSRLIKQNLQQLAAWIDNLPIIP
jgi:carbon monoxide dehydrogenase subunit G